MDKAQRLEAANNMLKAIASCGRKFFAYQDRVSQFEVDERGRVWLIDKYTQKRIYTHYEGRWRGFSDGGTLHGVIVRLRDFITQGKPLPPTIFGPWPDWICKGDLWGYGDAMKTVRQAAKEFQIVAEPKSTY